MTAARGLAIATVGLLLVARPLQAQDRSRYRDYQLGSDLRSVSVAAGVAASEAKTIHQRPAVMQELEWRPSYFATGSSAPQDDPVHQIVFAFYNDQLSRMVVDYDRDRTAGMTLADMVDALSTTYGTPLKVAVPKTGAVRSPLDEESGTPVARWGDTDYAVVLYRSWDLYRSPSESRFRLIVTSPRLDALARAADAQAIRLDQREAPQREVARQKKEAEDARVAQQKARVANKAAFRP